MPKIFTLDAGPVDVLVVFRVVGISAANGREFSVTFASHDAACEYADAVSNGLAFGVCVERQHRKTGMTANVYFA